MGIQYFKLKMPKGTTKKGKKSVVSSGAAAKSTGSGSLFKKSARNFRIGGNIQPQKNLTRYVKWPKYVRIQRQKRVLFMRLKSPPVLNIFTHCIEKNQQSQLMKLLAKYSPETKSQKKDRLQSEAEARKGGNKADHIGPKPNHLKFGLNHVTTLIEEKKAKLVCIASDVEPVELMLSCQLFADKMVSHSASSRERLTLESLFTSRMQLVLLSLMSTKLI